MFPIKDHNPSNKLPFVNIFIIALTSYVFFLEITSVSFEDFILRFALIPGNVDLKVPATLMPFLYSIFLHGGWMHIISNMWFLWIFGDNIESHLGHLNYLVFYLVS